MKTQEEKTNYLKFIKNLPEIGIVSFAEMVIIPAIRQTLQSQGNKIFTIDDVILALSRYDGEILFYKGDRVKGHVEEHLSDKRPYRFKQKCNVQLYLWKLHSPIKKARDSIKNLENFFIFKRVGNARYIFVPYPNRIVSRERKKRESILGHSRIRAEEISL